MPANLLYESVQHRDEGRARPLPPSLTHLTHFTGGKGKYNMELFCTLARHAGE